MMDYFSITNEAQLIYKERLAEAEKHRLAAAFTRQGPKRSNGLLVRSGEMLVSLGESLKRRGDVTYAYGNR